MIKDEELSKGAEPTSKVPTPGVIQFAQLLLKDYTITEKHIQLQAQIDAATAAKNTVLAQNLQKQLDVYSKRLTKAGGTYNKYYNKKLHPLVDKCRSSLPITVYMGYKVPWADEEEKIKFFCNKHDVEVAFPTSFKDENIKYLAVYHKVVASKEIIPGYISNFVHFNPFEPIEIGGRSKTASKPQPIEFYDPREFLNIPGSLIFDLINPAWKIDYKSLPIEIKLQLGLEHGYNEETITMGEGENAKTVTMKERGDAIFMEQLVNEITSELEESQGFVEIGLFEEAEEIETIAA